MNKDSLQKALREGQEIKSLCDSHRENSEPLAAENNLADWLGRLRLLHGIPFHYLVPNAAMLPMESIRFFYCNTTWLDYLQEGALSVGRSTSRMVAHDLGFASHVKNLGLLGVRNQRANAYAHLLSHMHPSKATLLTNTTAMQSDEKITGFLLRSGVVSGWKGLQVEAYDDNEKQPSQVLRMDHLSPNVLLCMFRGVIKSLRIHEEPEVLHFGVDISADAPHDFEKSFRYISGDKAGIQADDIEPLKINAYQRGKKGVLRVNDLATAMGEKVTKAGYTDHFTSREFALQMVEGVEAVKFSIE